MSFLGVFRRQPKWLVMIEALLLVGAIGWMDYRTGWEWSSFVFYSLPIVLVVWKTGRHLGFAFAFMCAVIWWLAQSGSHPYQTSWGFALAVVSRWFYFMVLVVATAAARAQRELDRTRIETLERMLDLEREIFEIADREKERLGRELHDGLCQTLAGVAALSASLAKKLAASSESAASASAAEVSKLLNEAICGAREMARGLTPLGLKESGLDGALETLSLSVQHLFHVACDIHIAGSFPRLGNELEVHLFRIAQEAVNNAVIHGRAHRIDIRLELTHAEGQLCIQDDGVGLPSETSHRSGIGLQTMAYRARMIGASLEVGQLPGRGTSVICAFPLPHPSANLELDGHALET